jgi:hypothetical protein
MLHTGSCSFFSGATHLGEDEVDSRRGYWNEAIGLVRCALPFAPMVIIGPGSYFNEYEKIEELVRILVPHFVLKIEEDLI